MFLTNLRVRGWMDYDELKKSRDDLIMMSFIGDRRGGPQVDYTVNPAVGFPTATGPADSTEPVGHVLPAWDCMTGQQAALSILAAERHRRATGQGQLIELALKDVALATLGHLGIIGEVTVNGVDRSKYGNALYGGYAKDFVSEDGARVIVVALTGRQWDMLKAASQTQAQCTELETKLEVKLGLEGERFKHRDAITAVLKPFFDSHTFDDIARTFDAGSVTWSRYRTFGEVVAEDPDCSTDHPMFAQVDHPGTGRYLTPGNAADFSGLARSSPGIAPRLGEHTEQILTEIGYGAGAIAKLHDDRIVASPRTS
jgi:2-methylfumaryl-CoA isomerase